jgi:hypothetical protein
MTLDSRMYSRDPMLIAMENQERAIKKTCAGCVHVVELRLMGLDLVRCKKWNIPAVKKCRSYKA